MHVRQLLAYLLVVVLSVGASVAAAENSLRDVEKLEQRINIKVATALDLVNKQRIAALEVVCIRDSATSKSSIEVRENQAKNDTTIANDKSTDPTVSKAKKDQVKAEKKSAKDLERLRCKSAATK